MAKDNDLKNAARSRMQQTGENYTTALRAVRGENLPDPAGWQWPDTVIPADLHPGPVDSSGIFVMRPVVEGSRFPNSTWDGTGPQPTPVEYEPEWLGTKGFYGSQPSDALVVRSRLSRISSVGPRAEWQLVDTAKASFADHPLRQLDPSNTETGRPDTGKAAFAMALLEDAMRRSSPEGWRWPLPTLGRWGVNQPAHTIAMNLVIGLLHDGRHDDALTVAENALWLCPEGMELNILSSLFCEALGTHHFDRQAAAEFYGNGGVTSPEGYLS